MYVCIYVHACLSLFEPCICSYLQRPKERADPLELELQMIVSCHVCWEPNGVFYESSTCSEPSSQHSSHPPLLLTFEIDYQYGVQTCLDVKTVLLPRPHRCQDCKYSQSQSTFLQEQAASVILSHFRCYPCTNLVLLNLPNIAIF